MALAWGPEADQVPEDSIRQTTIISFYIRVLLLNMLIEIVLLKLLQAMPHD